MTTKMNDILAAEDVVDIIATANDVAVFNDIEAEGEATFEMDAYSGGPLVVRGYDKPVIIDLAGLQIQDKTPALRDHQVSQVVGHFDRIDVQASAIHGAGVVSGSGDAAREVVDNHRKGFKWRSSIGVRPAKIEAIGANQSVRVNGRTFFGPVYVARESLLREISFVAVGADASSTVTVCAEENTESNMTFEQWAAQKGFDLSTIDEKNLPAIQAMYDAEQASKGDGGVVKDPIANTDTPETIEATGEADFITESRKKAAAETRRQAAVCRVTAGHPEIQAQALELGWTSDQAELAVLRQRPNVSANTGRMPTQQNHEVIQASLCISSGLLTEEEAAAEFGEQVTDQAISPSMRGAGIQAAFYNAIQAAGMAHMVTPGIFTNDTIRAAFRAQEQLIEAADWTTMSLSGILGDVANKALMKGWKSVQEVIPRISATTSTKDFKKYRSYRLTADGTFQELGPGGELKHMSFQESGHENKVETRGAIVTLTREMIINDDLGAFNQLPRLIGRQGRLKIEKEGHQALLANASNFFSTDNKNYLFGANYALGMTSLGMVAQKFMQLKDANGDPIMLIPHLLLVPTALSETADQIYKATHVNQASTDATPNTNNHAGKYQPVASPYLDEGVLTGGSDTTWYLLAHPEDAAMLEIAYLNGRQQPVVEQGQTSFNTLGIQYRAYLDFGIALGEEIAAIKVKGED